VGLVTALDWLVLVGTLGLIVGYGASSSRGVRTVDQYLRGDSSLRWPTIGLGIMATQASAITFLSTPGQAYEDGMRFVQFYFGLPLAMVVICVFFVPMYYKLDVLTAYEYLELRFDGRCARWAPCSSSCSAGWRRASPSTRPPSSSARCWAGRSKLTNVIMGLTVVVYTVLGGRRR
jgi:Na+/proline symporter